MFFTPLSLNKRGKYRKLLFSLHLADRLRRHCSLFSIDGQIPKLDVAGSIPVSRSFLFSQLQLLLIRRFAKVGC